MWMAEPHLRGVAQHLLLASSAKPAEPLYGFGQMAYAAVFKILEVSTVLNFAFIPENQMSRTLLRSQIVVMLHREQVHKSVPDAVRLCLHHFFGERADFHGPVETPNELLSFRRLSFVFLRLGQERFHFP